MENYMERRMSQQGVNGGPTVYLDYDIEKTDNALDAYTDQEIPKEMVDKFCDPDHPVKVCFQEVSAASFKIRSGIEKTPCKRSHMSKMFGMEIYFKKDFMQLTGSFKERGARYALMNLTEEQKEKGVVAASAGNHALALAYHGSQLKIPITVVMPETAPLMKIQNCKEHGASIIVHGSDFAKAKYFAMKLAEDTGMLYINGYDHPDILAGQGTMGIEIVEQVPDLDAVIVPVGGGGLLAGCALAVKTLCPNVKVYGVEPERCASLTAAMKAGKPTITPVNPTLADGLSVPLVGFNAFATLKPLVDKVITISEEHVALAILRLIEIEKCVVEGAGAVGLSAILENKMPELSGKKVVVILCGGNIDTTVLGRVLERGLAADSRLCRFIVTVSDRPGGIAALTRLIASIGVSLKDIFHERAWLRSDIFHVQVKCIVETRNEEHRSELEDLLKSHYKDVAFGSSIKPIF